jgi:maltose/maltodextrin transport system permease protein
MNTVSVPVPATIRPPSMIGRYGRIAATVLFAIGALYLVFVTYAVGQTLLAATLLVIVALAFWTYTSAKTQASRYLFPGVAAAIVFVVFPMLYTVSIGFTNYSSRNLLDFERARASFLEEAFRGEGPGYAFTLHPDAKQYRVRLVDQEDEAKVFVSADDRRVARIGCEHNARRSADDERRDRPAE